MATNREHTKTVASKSSIPDIPLSKIEKCRKIRKTKTCIK